jgi:hypothetical protein
MSVAYYPATSTLHQPVLLPELARVPIRVDHEFKVVTPEEVLPRPHFGMTLVFALIPGKFIQLEPHPLGVFRKIRADRFGRLIAVKGAGRLSSEFGPSVMMPIPLALCTPRS